MPYKDAEQKREWERLHRKERRARRRELRREEAAREEPRPEAQSLLAVRVVCCFLLLPEGRWQPSIPNSLLVPVVSRWQLPFSIRRIGAGGLSECSC